MGASKSKVRTLSPKTLLELQRNLDVDFTRQEIEEWFMEYQATLVSRFLSFSPLFFGFVIYTLFANDFVCCFLLMSEKICLYT